MTESYTLSREKNQIAAKTDLFTIFSAYVRFKDFKVMENFQF